MFGGRLESTSLTLSDLDTNPDGIFHSFSAAHVPDVTGFGPGDYSGGYTGAGDSIYWGAFDDVGSTQVQQGPTYTPVIGLGKTGASGITDVSKILAAAKAQGQAAAVVQPVPRTPAYLDPFATNLDPFAETTTPGAPETIAKTPGGTPGGTPGETVATRAERRRRRVERRQHEWAVVCGALIHHEPLSRAPQPHCIHCIHKRSPYSCPHSRTTTRPDRRPHCPREYVGRDATHGGQFVRCGRASHP